MKEKEKLKFIASRYDGVFCFESSIVVKNEFLEASWQGLKDREYAETLRDVLADISAKRQSALSATMQNNFSAAIQCRVPNFRMPYLIEYSKRHSIPEVKAWKIARDTWLNQTTVSSVVDLWEQFFSLKLSGEDSFMSPAESLWLKQLPTPLRIYRGYDGLLGRDIGRNSLSWTLSKMVASQFAVNTKRIAQAEVKKSDVIAYISARGQHEIVVRSVSCIRHRRAMNSVRGSNAMNFARGAKHNHLAFI
ncbi:hypothetical protein PY479_10395 [Shewanella sp. A32]|uniref:hypothetical protein n=1 Tax=Shewanella sp. A32 TaxID=3031327 RepID=UPI0023B95DEB|nr:hypothetical protein [Shewanella sp. A32]MDF0534680.1 hypothetical protein [Shewanella sp. A32]